MHAQAGRPLTIKSSTPSTRAVSMHAQVGGAPWARIFHAKIIARLQFLRKLGAAPYKALGNTARQRPSSRASWAPRHTKPSPEKSSDAQPLTATGAPCMQQFSFCERQDKNRARGIRAAVARMEAVCRCIKLFLLYGLALYPCFLPFLLLCANVIAQGHLLGRMALGLCQAAAYLCCILSAHFLKALFGAIQGGSTLLVRRALRGIGICGSLLAIALLPHALLYAPLYFLSMLCWLWALGFLLAFMALPCGNAVFSKEHGTLSKETSMKHPKFLARTICIILYLTLLALLVAFFFIPSVGRSLTIYGFNPYWAALVFLYLGWACAAWMAFEFVRIMSTVQKETPFIRQNVQSLGHIAICCGVCALDIFFMLFFNPSITLGLCAAILCFGCLCALVLGSVFGKAVLYKEENDLTV